MRQKFRLLSTLSFKRFAFQFFVLCDVKEQISEQLHRLDVQTFCLRGATILRKSGLKGEELNSLFQPEDEFRGQTKVQFTINNDYFEL